MIFIFHVCCRLPRFSCQRSSQVCRLDCHSQIYIRQALRLYMPGWSTIIITPTTYHYASQPQLASSSQRGPSLPQSSATVQPPYPCDLSKLNRRDSSWSYNMLSQVCHDSSFESPVDRWCALYGSCMHDMHTYMTHVCTT